MPHVKHCIVDFTLAAKDDAAETIDELDSCCFSNGIVSSEVYDNPNDTKHVRLCIMFQNTDPFWKLVDGNKTHEVTIYYDDTEILAKAYHFADAPKLNL